MLKAKDSISSSTVISDRQLGSQLTLLVALGMFFMVLSVSIGTSIIINKSLTNNFIQNGKNITGVLAKQSSLMVRILPVSWRSKVRYLFCWAVLLLLDRR